MNEWPEGSEGRVLAEALPDTGGCGCDAGDSGMVLRRSVVIPNSRGLHARAAAKLVTMAESFSACVNVVRNGESVPACSIMGLMMLAAGFGSKLTVTAEGADAEAAMEQIEALIASGFSENR